MDYANMKSLLEDPDIQELLLVLGIFERRSESKSLTELCEHMDEIKQTIEEVMLEVSGMREQLLQTNEKKTLRDSLLDTMEKLGEQAQDMTVRLSDIQQEIKDKSREVVQGVLNKGILGLRHMSDFLGVKDKLISLRGIAENNLVRTDEAITRMEQAASQARRAVVDVKNIGRSLTGKEMAESNLEKKHGIENVMTAPMKVHRNCISFIVEQIDRALDSIDSFFKDNVVRNKQPKKIDFTLEPKQEIVDRQREDTQPVNPVSIDTLLNAWEAQRKSIGTEVRPLLSDKARAL